MEEIHTGLPDSVIRCLMGHLNDFRQGKIYSKKYIDPKEYTLSKFLRAVYHSYSIVFMWLTYGQYIKLLIDNGLLESHQYSLVYKDQDYCTEPLGYHYVMGP